MTEWTKDRAAAVVAALNKSEQRALTKDVELWNQAVAAGRDSILDRLRNPDEAMVEACLCGWNNVASGFDFSTYQQSEETREAWRRVCCALADVLEKGKSDAE